MQVIKEIMGIVEQIGVLHYRGPYYRVDTSEYRVLKFGGFDLKATKWMAGKVDVDPIYP